ncbi:MAG: hypothetical protein IKX00_03365 [Bacilli bacterium]|nr:hypothetical protein [Bacilli bacterium]
MAKRSVGETIIDAIICGTVFGITSSCVRSCQNKNDMKKYYAESQNNTSVAVIIDGKLYMYNNPSDMNFMPNDAYLNKSFNKENNSGGVNDSIKDIKDEYGNADIVVMHTTDIEYSINYLDNKTMIIYTYNEDEYRREMLTKYILSNISLDEENNIIFNKDDISYDGYKNFKNNILKNSDVDIKIEQTQRTRSVVEN